MWSLACPDWEARIRTGRSLVPTLPFDAAAKQRAARAVAIFDRLRLADVPGNPTLKDAAGDWFRDIVRALFGAWDPIAQERWIREVFALVPKKNSKTSYGAGAMLTALLMNERPKAKFLLVAPTQDVTELAFGQVEGMVALDPFLNHKQRIRVQSHLKRVTYVKTGATLEIMSFDPEVLTGQKPAGFMVDELHVVSGSSKAASAVGQLRGGMIAQPEAFGLFITTQSEKPPAGVFKAELNKARSIRDGRASGRTLAVLYEFPDAIARDETAWRDPSVWPMVIPNNGRSITVERLVEELATADLLGEEEVRRWATQHLNVEAGLAFRSEGWVGARFWEKQADPDLTFEALLERCDVVCVGVDGGGLDDLFGLAVLGRDKVTRDWLLWTHAWCHEGVLERRKSIAGRLRDFEALGELTIVDDELADIGDIVDHVRRVEESGLLACVAVDPAGLGELIDALATIGVTQEDKRVVGAPQGFGMMNSIKTAERKLANGTFWHSGSTLAAWCVGNLKIEPMATAIRATKQNAGDAKIDVAMAMFDGVVPMVMNPEPSGSIYTADRGLVVFG